MSFLTARPIVASGRELALNRATGQACSNHVAGKITRGSPPTPGDEGDGVITSMLNRERLRGLLKYYHREAA